uniref:Uncharacterized protein n=1 Tax=Rhizophora mucronata TaxID=61149 RepID=A0A2P2PT27_RHIMU
MIGLPVPTSTLTNQGAS